jgi:hypothetical protein
MLGRTVTLWDHQELRLNLNFFFKKKDKLTKSFSLYFLNPSQKNKYKR